MNELRSLTFHDKNIFDTFYNNISKIDYIVLKLLLDDYINIDGSLKIENVDKIDKKSLWTYIYYLWQHNKNQIIFKDMTNEQNNNASAFLFLSNVIKVLKDKNYKSTENFPYDSGMLIEKDDLSMFIMILFKEVQEINLPVIESIFDKIIDSIDGDYQENKSKKTLKIDIVL